MGIAASSFGGEHGSTMNYRQWHKKVFTSNKERLLGNSTYKFGHATSSKEGNALSEIELVGGVGLSSPDERKVASAEGDGHTLLTNPTTRVVIDLSADDDSDSSLKEGEIRSPPKATQIPRTPAVPLARLGPKGSASNPIDVDDPEECTVTFPRPLRRPIPAPRPLPQPLPAFAGPSGTEMNPESLIDPLYIVKFPRTQEPPDQEDGEMIMFCDASVRAQFGGADRFGGAGVAYKSNGTWRGRAVGLGPMKDSVAAEACAILEALKLARSFDMAQFKTLRVYSDCQSALQQLRAAKLNPSYARSQTYINILYEQEHFAENDVEMIFSWVKGHHVCTRNKLADMLAGLAAGRSMQGLHEAVDDPYIDEEQIVDEQNVSRAARRSRHDMREAMHSKAARRSEKNQMRAGRQAGRCI